MKEQYHRWIVAILFSIIMFGAGYALATYNTLNWFVDIIVKLLNSDSGAELLFKLLKAHSLPSKVSIFNTSIW